MWRESRIGKDGFMETETTKITRDDILQQKLASGGT